MAELSCTASGDFNLECRLDAAGNGVRSVHGLKVCVRMYDMPHVTVDVHYATFYGGCTDAKYFWMYIMPHLTVDGSMSHLTVDVQMPSASGCTLCHI